ncbi:VOC family protein [Pediococcus claussenii]|uniref:Glyoxalase family protein n=1 Tax=Pediococcus claussenii (strain ATCC BAA-344 / DSM 14800 / JCM 18046 / KCTC 3811 / LMG 21948 / P06) TaxID=701521 RepID=G8PAE4_PEDCP|nr:VOC family protein [Pediococcus claussenii]AEV95733.1 glyoxalase family protein [Pediococcus claussenii ATCC BAA-344]ANZ69242.1 hypothetical protein AYR57_02520 [Pediococcus claussenii]ANZ71061.1 hypothetical protein AYR58_02535 [Pediococcus claussenii]KRN20032.1 hypothetical protein IV79_GL000695 [Pediococcus claussenii]
MKIEHAAIWVQDIEKIRNFYLKYFRVSSSEMYHNEKTGFYSYFLSFPDGGARLEVMHQDEALEKPKKQYGYAHIALSLGSKDAVNQMTNRLQADGYKRTNGPRTTGDGYYESVFEDPEGNTLELTV